MNERIVESIYAAMKGEIDVPRQNGGWCLRAVRKVLENALGWGDEELFDRFPKKIETLTPEPRAFWARDIQRSFREAGWTIPLSEAIPGDVVSYWQAARNEYGEYVGHIALVSPHGYVFENVNPEHREGIAGVFTDGALSLTPFQSWGTGEEIEAFRVPKT